MKGVVPISLFLGVASVALAQYGGAGPRTYGSPSGFGNVLFPGTGTPPNAPGNIIDPGFAARLHATVSGFPPYTGAPVGSRRGARYSSYIPYSVPIYLGDYGSFYQPYPQVTDVAPQQPAPQVIINQYFTPDTARPVVREYSSEEPASSGIRVYEAPSRTPAEPAETARSAEDRPTVYLIVFRDNSIQSALAYWVDGDTLHYVTVQGSHNKVSLDLVDRRFSEQINRERNIDFRLPAK